MLQLPDDERKWLVDLNKDLWKPRRANARRNPVGLDAERELTLSEFKKVFSLIKKYSLVTTMFSSNMFGGYGIEVYAHEEYPGTGAQHLLTLTEDNLPTPSRLQRVAGVKSNRKKTPGSGRDDAWKIFSKHTHSKLTREWVKMYRLREPKERFYYDY